MVRLRRLLFLTLLFTSSSGLLRAQSADRANALKLFQAGDFPNAVKLLKAVVKKDATDAEAWYMLGGSYLSTRKYKDSIKALKKAAELDQQNAAYRALLAYLYVVVNDDAALATANEALMIDANNAEAHFVLGALAYRGERFSNAYDRAKRAVQLKPGFAGAYRLKAQALIASYMSLDGKVLPPAVRGDLLPEAVADLEKFLALATDAGQRKEVEEELPSLRYFADFYSHPENRIIRDASEPEPPDPNRTPLKILSKPPPSYTDGARQRNAQGTVILQVAFDAIGRLGPILVVKSLDPELDREALKAARRIKFIPATRNGGPVTSVRKVEYSFRIY